MEFIEDKLLLFIQKTGYIQGIIKSLAEEHYIQTLQDILVAEAIKTSEIEGEYISRKDVLSSIKNNLGVTQKEQIRDVHAKGIANMVTEVKKTFKETLTQKALFMWHTMIFPTATKIAVGKWRSHLEPIQIVYGAMGREIVHFEAPPSKQVAEEMKSFIHWFNNSALRGNIT